MPTMQTAQTDAAEDGEPVEVALFTTDEPASELETAPPNMLRETATLAAVQQDEHHQQHAGEHEDDSSGQSSITGTRG